MCNPEYCTFFFFVDFFLFIYFYYLEANYFTTFQWVLSYIDMNQPWSYMYSSSQSPLPPPSPPDSSGSSQCTRPEHLSHASSKYTSKTNIHQGQSHSLVFTKGLENRCP